MFVAAGALEGTGMVEAGGFSGGCEGQERGEGDRSEGFEEHICK